MTRFFPAAPAFARSTAWSAPEELRCRCDGADWRLADREIDERGRHRQSNVRVPHPGKVAEVHQRDASEPCPEESPDLVGERREPEQGREVTHTEQLADESGRR